VLELKNLTSSRTGANLLHPTALLSNVFLIIGDTRSSTSDPDSTVDVSQLFLRCHYNKETQLNLLVEMNVTG
jgi:hypothetical protein